MPYAYPEQVSLRSYNPTVQGHRGQIKRALQTIMAAKRPIMYVGGGAINAACHEELLILAEKLNLPVTSSLMGLGSFLVRIAKVSACWGCMVPLKPIWPCTILI